MIDVKTAAIAAILAIGLAGCNEDDNADATTDDATTGEVGADAVVVEPAETPAQSN